ncbi:MAG: glutathione S-transferase [Bdellovibrionota bacterium]
MLTLHLLENSRAHRIVWLLEELEIPYEIRTYLRDPKTLLAPPELKLVHPLGKSPVITDDGVTLAESAAILEYLVEKYDTKKLLSPSGGSPERLRYTYWLHYAEGSLMPPLLIALVFHRVETAPVPFFVKPIVKQIVRKVEKQFIKPQLTTHLNYLESELTKNLWFAGKEFSAADIQLSYPLEAVRDRGGLDAKYPKLLAYLERIHARPAYQRAEKRGGGVDFRKF